MSDSEKTIVAPEWLNGQKTIEPIEIVKPKRTRRTKAQMAELRSATDVVSANIEHPKTLSASDVQDAFIQALVPRSLTPAPVKAEPYSWRNAMMVFAIIFAILAGSLLGYLIH